MLAAVLNVISYSHAYSLYPRATFDKRIALSLIPSRMVDQSVLRKYSDRGWKFVDDIPNVPVVDISDDTYNEVMLLILAPRLHECHQCAHCLQKRVEEQNIVKAFPKGPRWIGDKHSWVLPLNLDGVNLPTELGDSSDSTPMSRDPSFITSWEMVDRTPRNGEKGKKIRAKVVNGDGFYYTYVITDTKLKAAMATIQELYVHIPDVAADGK